MTSRQSAFTLSLALAAALSPATVPGAAAAPPGTISIASVGRADDGACLFDDVQEAIDHLESFDVETRILRVSRSAAPDGAFSVSTLVVTKPITLVGGQATCAAQPTPGVHSTFSAFSGGVMEIAFPTGAERGTVRLESIRLENGNGENGGGLAISGPVDVELENGLVIDNVAASGGGIFVDGGGATLRMVGTGVNGNRTNGSQGLGGGIRCVGPARVEIARSGLLFNETSGTFGLGGGISLSRCDLHVLGPADLSHNDANAGGALYASGDSELVLEGTADGPVRLFGNEARGAGGAINLDSGARLRATATEIDGNVTDGSGGALFLQTGAVALFDRGSVSADCEDPGNCTVLRENEAVRGAAVASFGGSVTLRDVVVEDHQMDPGQPTAVFDIASIDGLNPHLRLVGVTVAASSAHALVAAEGAATAQLDHVTFAGNFGFNGIFDARTNSSGTGSIALRNSIISAPSTDPLVAPGSAPITASCSFVHVVDGLAPGSTVFQVNPGLVDPGARNLHLTEGASAIDVCVPLADVPADYDLEGRGFDDPSEANFGSGTTADAGADERTPIAGVFFDGFEGGDTSRWSATAGASN